MTKNLGGFMRGYLGTIKRRFKITFRCQIRFAIFSDTLDKQTLLTLIKIVRYTYCFVK